MSQPLRNKVAEWTEVVGFSIQTSGGLLCT